MDLLHAWPQVLEPANLHLYRETTLGQYLVEKRYSKMFTYNYVVPMCAAVWSVPNAQVRATRGGRGRSPLLLGSCQYPPPLFTLPYLIISPPSPLQVLQFPVQMLIRFWVNHHLLDIFQRPLWRVVKGRSREYVNRVLQGVCVSVCVGGGQVQPGVR